MNIYRKIQMSWGSNHEIKHYRWKSNETSTKEFHGKSSISWAPSHEICELCSSTAFFEISCDQCKHSGLRFWKHDLNCTAFCQLYKAIHPCTTKSETLQKAMARCDHLSQPNHLERYLLKTALSNWESKH